MTYDEYRRWRRPWEENHRILGEDTINDYDCFVIESKNYRSNYYLSKRISWVEKKNFIDIHEEQFDRKGRLLKVFDKKWEQIKPWDYWAWRDTRDPFPPIERMSDLPPVPEVRWAFWEKQGVKPELAK